MISLFTRSRQRKQSEILKPKLEVSQPKKTQKRNSVEREVPIAIVGDKGFWVDDNKFFVADIRDGYIDPNDAEEINAFDIPGNQLGYLFKILDKIKEQ